MLMGRSSSDMLKTFSTESQHSFSYAFISQSSISSRLEILKRALEFLRSNPALANLGPNNSSSSTTALEGFFKQHANKPTATTTTAASNNGPLASALPIGPSSNSTALRSSASSAALSMLTNYTSLNAAEPSLTAFDTNLKSILVLLENAHVFPSSPQFPLAEPRHITRTVSNPPILLRPPLPRIPSGTATPPRPLGGQNRVPSGPQKRPELTLSTPAKNPQIDPSRLQFQLLDSLATPYIDTEVTSSTLFHPLSSKFASNQAVFTSDSLPPYKILTGNEMGCLVFGMSKAEIRKLNLIDLVGASHKDYLKSKIATTKNSVFLCGEILPITKYNGQSGYGSFWAKCPGSGIITWVIEEVVCNISTVQVDSKTGIVTGKIDKESLLPPLTDDILVHDVISGLPQDLDMPNTVEHHVTISDGEVLPCAIKVLNKEPLSIEILTLPHIAGVLIIDKESRLIDDYNTSFFSNLFGYSSRESCKGWSIDDIIPYFTWYLDQIIDSCNIDMTRTGLVIPEHLFRKMAAKRGNIETGEEEQKLFFSSKGIEGLHKDSHLITLDVQLRIVGADKLVLWVTYTHDIKGVKSAAVPSQLTLLSMKKKMHRPSISRGESPMVPETPPLDLSSPLSGPTTPQTSTPASPEAVTSNNNNNSIKDYLTAVNKTPREEALRNMANSPYSPGSPYIVHIPELGARRRTKTLNDFNILQKMGEGAHGRVLLAEYKEEPKLKVVLKCVIKERILVDAWVRDRKLGTIPSEIKILAALTKGQHPNITQILDFFEDDQFYHIEMEPHGDPGTDLFDLIELQPRMPEHRCRELFVQVVSAVRYLHSQDIVHRDLKDENIIVDGSGLLKVIDFGSAAFVKQGPFDVFVGTIDYAAPEVLAGKPYSGKPQDVWALGILLYTIVFRENPFYSVDEIMSSEDLRVPFSGVSEECLDLVRRILNRSVDERLTVEDVWNHPWLETGDLE